MTEVAGSSGDPNKFSETILVNRLRDLTGTMDNIQNLSIWLQHHRKHSMRICEVWLKELKRERSPKKLINLVYVANDVIQNSRKKWPLFLEHFLPVLDKGFAQVAKYSDERTTASLKKVIRVWSERGVYSKEPITSLIYTVTSNLTNKNLTVWNDDSTSHNDLKSPTTPSSKTNSSQNGSSSHSSSKKRASRSSSSPGWDSTEPSSSSSDNSVAKRLRESLDNNNDEEPVDAPSTAELLDALRQLEEPASADASIREKIASFREDVADPNYLKRIANPEQADALYAEIRVVEPVVTDYCQRLSEEIKHRRSTQHMLCSYILAQKQKADQLNSLLDQFKQKKEQLNRDRVLAYEHYALLPDLSKLPTPTQMKPLPSAGELFNK